MNYQVGQNVSVKHNIRSGRNIHIAVAMIISIENGVIRLISQAGEIDPKMDGYTHSRFDAHSGRHFDFDKPYHDIQIVKIVKQTRNGNWR